jgi:hypothetical protein
VLHSGFAHLEPRTFWPPGMRTETEFNTGLGDDRYLTERCWIEISPRTSQLVLVLSPLLETVGFKPARRTVHQPRQNRLSAHSSASLK